MPVSIAGIDNIPALVSLLNSAYRGEGSKKGWTTEADLVEGSLRTDEKHLGNLMRSPGTVFLKYESDDKKIEGCVFLQKREGKLYLGMLSVSPDLQAKGIGRQLMRAAEQYAAEQGCSAIFMRVIDTRAELIAWYERQGYVKTGQKEPFEDSAFGRARRPIEFVVMQKSV